MKPSEKNDFDVIIVGAGMVGLTVASLLQDSKLRVALVDKNEATNATMEVGHDQPKFDARVSALSASSREILKQLGVWNLIEKKRHCDFEKMHVWDADGTGSIVFSADDLSVPRLGTIIENSFVVDALMELLKIKGNVELFRPCSVNSLDESEERVTLNTVEHQMLRAKLVIAADGANSKIRELSNFRVREWEYNHHAIVTTVKTEMPHQKTALQRFMPTGPLAFLPLSSDTGSDCQEYSSIVWSAEPSYAQSLINLSDNDFCIELTISAEARFGEVTDCSARYLFPLRQRHSVNYSQSRIVLVGDAAHSIHPLAGQGVNLGLLDAKALSNEITRGLSAGRAVCDPTIMNRYQRARKGHNLGMMALMEGFKRVFEEDALAIRWLRNFGISSINNLPPVKNFLARRAMGLDS